MENLKSIFLLIFNMSITATYVAIAIIAIRIFLFKKYPKILSYSLWGILLFRLMSPISFSSAFSFLNLLKSKAGESTRSIEYIPQNIEMMQAPAIDVGINRINNIVNTSFSQATEFASMNPMQFTILISTVIWMIGIIGLILYNITAYRKVISKVQTATLCEDSIVAEVMNKISLKRRTKVYVTDQIESPFVLGLIVPKIYIPINITRQEWPYILTHEFVHVKRGDYIIKPLGYFMLMLHWFNPILWLSFRLMSKDMEMSCDEKVMEILGDEIKQDYAHSLLSLAVKENRLLQGSPLAFGESNVKLRIKNILKFKKPSSYVLTVVIILIATIGFVLLANPIEKMENTVKGLDYEKIYEHKTRYVGDASKVSGLANHLYYTEFKNGIALQTNIKPYGLTVNYNIKAEDFMEYGGIQRTDKMLKNAAMMFCLIDNVEKISFNFGDGSNIHSFSFQREFFNKIYGEDIRNYASSFNKFRNEFVSMLERENWSNAEFKVYLTNKIELYLWRNKNITGTDDAYYTLLPGTNKPKDEKEIYNLNIATKDIERINNKLSQYQRNTHLAIRHDRSFSKEDMMATSDDIIFNGESRSIGVFGEGFNQDKPWEIGMKVEELLQTIMSSPKESSDPKDYIEAHQNEYETILKIGDGALQYMLSLFEQGKNEGLKAHIMMALCIDLLGDRNNVEENSYTSPKEWYAKLSPYEDVKLPPFKYKPNSDIDKLVYAAALKQYSPKQNGNGVTIVAPKIFGSFEKEKELKIFVTVYYDQFKLYGKILHSESAGVVPAAIIYTKNDDGRYTFKEYIEAMDGAYFNKSIEEFCEPRDDIAKAMMNYYSDYRDLFELMNDHLKYYLKENNMKGIQLKKDHGDIVPLT
ncbi:M56 family metallopeptidase [Clostridiaceae bacterium 35-E11]